MQLALFDFDHTLTSGDSYARFLRSIATPDELSRAKWTIGPWLLGYRLGLVSAAGIRARATREAFNGRDAAEVAAHGAGYARDVLPGLLRPDMMQRLAWHLAQGHQTTLVSGSLDLYLQPWCEQHGVDLICNQLESNEGRLSGRYAPRDIGMHKADEIRARYELASFERIHAYGDSREDRQMLALAHERWYRGKRVA